jgi:hypothetical protein
MLNEPDDFWSSEHGIQSVPAQRQNMFQVEPGDLAGAVRASAVCCIIGTVCQDKVRDELR